MKNFISLILISLILSSCYGSRVVDIKSPCVSNSGGPCGPKKSVNDWWLKSIHKS